MPGDADARCSSAAAMIPATNVPWPCGSSGAAPADEAPRRGDPAARTPGGRRRCPESITATRTGASGGSAPRSRRRVSRTYHWRAASGSDGVNARRRSSPGTHAHPARGASDGRASAASARRPSRTDRLPGRALDAARVPGDAAARSARARSEREAGTRARRRHERPDRARRLAPDPHGQRRPGDLTRDGAVVPRSPAAKVPSERGASAGACTQSTRPGCAARATGVRRRRARRR